MKIKFRLKLMIMIMFIWACVTSLSAQTPREPIAGVDPPDFDRVGQTGWQFLHLPTTARSAALADIKNGFNNYNVTAIFNNPANLVGVENIDASFTQVNYVADISYMTAAVAKNFGALGTVGFFFANLDIGDMVRTQNIYSEELGITQRSGDMETFTAGDIQVGLSYAQRITDRLCIGGNVSYIEENLDKTKVKNWNTDFGIYYKTGFKSLRLSMVARNFGPDKEFTGFTELYGVPQSVRMPVDFRLGIGFDPIESSEHSPHRLSTYLEGVHPNDGPERIHAAIEYSFLELFALRGGYKFNYDEQGLTLGGGLCYNTKNFSGRIDYAYVAFGRLTQVHMFSLGFGL